VALQVCGLGGGLVAASLFYECISRSFLTWSLMFSVFFFVFWNFPLLKKWWNQESS
jgi:hypothetical protein